MDPIVTWHRVAGGVSSEGLLKKDTQRRLETSFPQVVEWLWPKRGGAQGPYGFTKGAPIIQQSSEGAHQAALKPLGSRLLPLSTQGREGIGSFP
jgi:hypothetical protein